jgi:hypothetical protein
MYLYLDRFRLWFKGMRTGNVSQMGHGGAPGSKAYEG